MCFPKPEVPKEDPAVKQARKEQMRRELEAARLAKAEMLETRRGEARGTGVRSLITGSPAGYGRNFI